MYFFCFSLLYSLMQLSLFHSYYNRWSSLKSDKVRLFNSLVFSKVSTFSSNQSFFFLVFLSSFFVFFFLLQWIYRAIGLMSKVFTNGPGNRDSIRGRVIPKTKKMVIDASLHSTQVKTLVKVEQYWEWRNALPLHLSLVAVEKGAFRTPLTNHLYL